MSKIPFVRVLSTLWKMLTPKRRVAFLAWVALLFVAGTLDMGGMLLIFGFIAGLKVDPETGERAGKLVRLLSLVFENKLSNQEYVLIVGGLVIGVMAIKNLLSTLVQFGLNRFLMKLNQQVSVGLFEGYLVKPYEQLAADGISDARGRIIKIFEVFYNCFSSLAQILADGALLSIVALLLFFVDPGLTVGAVVVFAGAGALLYGFMQKSLVDMGRRDQRYRSDANGYLADGMDGLIDTRLRDARAILSAGYERSLSQTGVLRRRSSALRKLPRSTNEMLLTVMIVGSVFYLTYSGGTVQDALPTLALFGYAGLRLTGAISRINSSAQDLKRNAEQFERYYATVLQLAPHLFGEPEEATHRGYLAEEQTGGVGQNRELKKALVADGVTFRYPRAKHPAIRNMSVEIPAGSFTSFCGPSGGGKSTLVLLLLGLLTPQKGKVCCDDWSIHEHIRAWHRNVGYVGQNLYLSPRTLRENVAFAVPLKEIDDDLVWRALRLAAANEFVEALSGQLDFVLKEGGTNLSGGQRQRLVIARALYHDPSVIVFDEATAALDNITEREITAALKNLNQSKTVICIAHRLSTIRESQRIHVVEAGTISASGTYEELLNSSDTFAELARVPEDDRS
jgi:ABC-type multidrug transport system fused ATPase/permease subunit